MPGTYAGTLLVFIMSLGFFVTPAVLGGGPRRYHRHFCSPGGWRHGLGSRDGNVSGVSCW